MTTIAKVNQIAVASIAKVNQIAMGSISKIDQIGVSVGEASPYTDSSQIRTLIHSNTSNGDTVFVDSGGNRSPVAVADAQHSTTVAKFGTTSMKFDGAGDAITIDGKSPDDAFIFGSGDFSIDFWWNAGSTNDSDERDGLIGLYNTGTDYDVHIGIGGSATNWSTGGDKICFSLNYDSGWQAQAIGTTDINDNAWHNIRLVRDGTSWKVYVDGTAEIDVTETFSIPNCHAIIGAHIPSDRWAVGYIDDLLIIGEALNAGDYTPRTTAWPDPDAPILDELGAKILDEDSERIEEE
jgi:hypothetical protein